jgi:outer membrane protein TolC
VYLTAGLSLSWQFDVSMLGDARGKEGALGAARVQEERARQEARDAVHEAWQRVRTGIARSRAARSETEQALAAADAANERYAAGSGTQLDLIQARRDLTSAEASRIQADADLSYARVALRLAVGELSEGGAR